MRGIAAWRAMSLDGLQGLFHVRALLDEYLGAALLALYADVVDIGPYRLAAVASICTFIPPLPDLFQGLFLDLWRGLWRPCTADELVSAVPAFPDARAFPLYLELPALGAFVIGLLDPSMFFMPFLTLTPYRAPNRPDDLAFVVFLLILGLRSVSVHTTYIIYKYL